MAQLPVLLNDSFRVVSYSGGSQLDPELSKKESEQEFGIHNALKKGSEEPHCSKDGKNFDLVVEYAPKKGSQQFVLSHLVLRAPEGCSAPIKSAVVFVSEAEPKVETYTKVFDNTTAVGFSFIPKEHRDRATFLEVDRKRMEVQVELPVWKKGRFIHVKLLGPFTDVEEPGANIDVRFIGFVGWDEAKAPKEPTRIPQIPPSLGVTLRVPDIKDLNPVHEDFMAEIDTKTCVCVFGNDAAVTAALRGVAQSGDFAEAGKGFISKQVYFFRCDKAAEKEDEEACESMRRPFGLAPGEVGVGATKTEQNLKFMMDRDKPYTAATVREFVDKVASGFAPEFKKSQKRTPGDVHPKNPALKLLTGSNFTDIVLDEDTNVLVELYSEESQDCKNLGDVTEVVAQVLKDIGADVVVGRLDVDLNDFADEYFEEGAVPLLKFFPKGNKDEPNCGIAFEFETEPTVLNFLKWVRRNMAGDKFELSKQIEQRAKDADEVIKARREADDVLSHFKTMLKRLGKSWAKPDESKLSPLIKALEDSMKAGDAAAIRKAEKALGTSEVGELCQKRYGILVKACALRDNINDAIQEHPALIGSKKDAKTIRAVAQKLTDALPERKKRRKLKGQDDVVDEENDGGAEEKKDAKPEKIVDFKALEPIVKETLHATKQFMAKVEAAEEKAMKATLKNVVLLKSEEQLEQAKNAFKKGGAPIVALDLVSKDAEVCELLSPAFCELSVEPQYESVAFFRLDVDRYGELCDSLDVETLPCVIFWKEGQEVGRLGDADPEALQAILDGITGEDDEGDEGDFMFGDEGDEGDFDFDEGDEGEDDDEVLAKAGIHVHKPGKKDDACGHGHSHGGHGHSHGGHGHSHGGHGHSHGPAAPAKGKQPPAAAPAPQGKKGQQPQAQPQQQGKGAQKGAQPQQQQKGAQPQQQQKGAQPQQQQKGAQPQQKGGAQPQQQKGGAQPQQQQGKQSQKGQQPPPKKSVDEDDEGDDGEDDGGAAGASGLTKKQEKNRKKRQRQKEKKRLEKEAEAAALAGVLGNVPAPQAAKQGGGKQQQQQPQAKQQPQQAKPQQQQPQPQQGGKQTAKGGKKDTPAPVEAAPAPKQEAPASKKGGKKGGAAQPEAASDSKPAAGGKKPRTKSGGPDAGAGKPRTKSGGPDEAAPQGKGKAAAARKGSKAKAEAEKPADKFKVDLGKGGATPAPAFKFDFGKAAAPGGAAAAAPGFAFSDFKFDFSKSAGAGAGAAPAAGGAAPGAAAAGAGFKFDFTGFKAGAAPPKKEEGDEEGGKPDAGKQGSKRRG